jgi:hypothetical protein
MRAKIGAILLSVALLCLCAPLAGAAAPDYVEVDGEWKIDRRLHDACVVAVPDVIGGDIHIEADFVNGHIDGWIDGDGTFTSSYTLPAECEHADPDDYDKTHLETWTGTLSNITGEFSGEFDTATGEFEIDVFIFVDSVGEASAPGRQYMCETDYWTPTCDLGPISVEQWGVVSGVVLPFGISDGEIDWYTAFCARISPGHTKWGEDCPTVGDWQADVTEVVWGENEPPEVGEIGATPIEPSSEDTVTFVVTATDPDADELTYTWFFDGVIDPASGPQATWSKPPPGDHEIEVDVSDGVDTIERYLDIRVSEAVGAGDQDDDGVPDDEDLCPTEWGQGDDGCPPFAVSLGCAPAQPVPEKSVNCGAEVAGRHVGESVEYHWYLDDSSVGTGGSSWAWSSAEAGPHEVVVEVLGEGRTAEATLSLAVGELVDEATAGFAITSLSCGSATSDEALACSVFVERRADDVGALSVSWIIDGTTAASTAIGVADTTSNWSIDQPAPGTHEVQTWVADPATGYALNASVSAPVKPGKNAMIPPITQGAAAAGSLTAVGAWLWLEWMRGQRAEAEAKLLSIDDIPLERNDDGQYRWPDDGQWVTREEALSRIAEDRYWQDRNKSERQTALLDHETWSEKQWERLKQNHALEIARHKAEMEDRRLRWQKFNRIEAIAEREGWSSMLNSLGKNVLGKGDLPSWQEFSQLRQSMYHRQRDQAFIDHYYRKSNLRFFAEGCQDTLAWGTGKVFGAGFGPGAGQVAEWMVRNPVVPLRIGLAVMTGGKSELALIPLDAYNFMSDAADRKMAEQNLNLTGWEATKECIRAGAWYVGGEMAADVVYKGAALLRGTGTTGKEVVETYAQRAARATQEEFEYRVLLRRSLRGADRSFSKVGKEILEQQSQAAGRAAGTLARETVEEAAEALSRFPPARPPRLVQRPDGSWVVFENDHWLKYWAREGEVLDPSNYHQAGLTVRDARALNKIMREEGAEAITRTTNMESMAPIRDGTAGPKWMEMKGKTIKFEDTFLGAKAGDEGLAGHFKPKGQYELVDGVEIGRPNLRDVPEELHDAVTKRFHERLESFNKVSKDPAFKKLLANKRIRIENGKVIDVLTNKPLAGDIDVVMFRDKATGKLITKGPRYDRIMEKWRAMGGQHGSEVTIVEDMTKGLRPGTPEHTKAVAKWTAFRDEVLQKAHSSGKEVTITFDGDVVRRGPRDISLSPDASEIFVDTSMPRPAAVPRPSFMGGVGGSVQPPPETPQHVAPPPATPVEPAVVEHAPTGRDLPTRDSIIRPDLPGPGDQSIAPSVTAEPDLDPLRDRTESGIASGSRSATPEESLEGLDLAGSQERTVAPREPADTPPGTGQGSLPEEGLSPSGQSEIDTEPVAPSYRPGTQPPPAVAESVDPLATDQGFRNKGAVPVQPERGDTPLPHDEFAPINGDQPIPDGIGESEPGGLEERRREDRGLADRAGREPIEDEPATEREITREGKEEPDAR